MYITPTGYKKNTTPSYSGPTARGHASGHKFNDMHGILMHPEVNKLGESLFQQSLSSCYEKLGYTADEIKYATERLEPAGP